MFGSNSFGLRANQVLAFFLTFAAFASLHCTRKSFSNIKGHLKDEWDFDNTFLGLLDALFMFAYAIGLFCAGILGDRFDLRLVIFLGLFFSTICVSMFAVGGFANIHTPVWFAVCWAANGLFQSSGWPSNLSIMANWLPRNSRGGVVGLWASSGCVGNIIGSSIVTAVLLVSSWPAAMLSAAAFQLFVALLVFTFVVPHPSANLLTVNDVDDNSKTSVSHENLPPISFLAAWRIPGVVEYSVSYACLKLVNYSLFFWLPLFLRNGLHLDGELANGLSNFYDGGQIFGGFLAGVISDRMGIRTPITMTMLLLSAASLSLFRLCVPGDKTLVSVLMVLTGFLVGGPANMISGAVAADLGLHPKLKGNARALSTVTGIVDGTGSLGAAGGQYLIGYLSDVFDWNVIFTVFVILAVMATIFLIPVAYRDFQQWRAQHHRVEVEEVERLMPGES